MFKGIDGEGGINDNSLYLLMTYHKPGSILLTVFCFSLNSCKMSYYTNPILQKEVMSLKSLVTCLGIKSYLLQKASGQAAYTAHVFAPDLHRFFGNACHCGC